MSDTIMKERFAALAASDDDSDWGEVLARAGIARSRRLVLVALAVVIALGAGAAIGVHLRAASAAPVPGPKHVQRQVKNGTIAWLFAHKPRGESLAAAHIPLLSTTGAHWQPVKFARVLTPDPSVKATIVVSLIGKRGRNICMTVFFASSSGGGCALGLDLRPFSALTMSGLDIDREGGSLVAGMASDDVARMELFVGHGRHRAVPLEDNGFVVSLTSSDYPANLVAYDKNGLVIGRHGSAGPVHLN
ncbi:MAG TPA: hypothetical protein VHV52_07525 [Gaiellaceae bacterium]|nr:hypothetical protein [Gaiellaceae bacterium]